MSRRNLSIGHPPHKAPYFVCEIFIKKKKVMNEWLEEDGWMKRHQTIKSSNLSCIIKLRQPVSRADFEYDAMFPRRKNDNNNNDIKPEV